MRMDELFEFFKEPNKKIENEEVLDATCSLGHLCMFKPTNYICDLEVFGNGMYIHIFNKETKEQIGIFKKKYSKYWLSQYYRKTA